MKTQKTIAATLTALVVVAGMATVTMAEENDELVTLAQTPAAVQQTIQQHAAAADIKKIELEDENGRTAYEVEIVKDNVESEIKVAADGTLIGSEEGIALSEAPEAVRATIATYAGDGKVLEITKETENGEVEYEAIVEQNGDKRELVITAQGKLDEMKKVEDEEDEDEGHDGEQDD